MLWLFASQPLNMFARPPALRCTAETARDRLPEVLIGHRLSDSAARALATRMLPELEILLLRILPDHGNFFCHKAVVASVSRSDDVWQRM